MLEWRENVLAYARTDQNQRIVVIINNSDALEEVTVPVWQAEIPDAWTYEKADVFLS